MCDQHSTVLVEIPGASEREHLGTKRYIDACISPLVNALNWGGFPTVSSCCGHGNRPGVVALADGRWLVIAADRETYQYIDDSFPVTAYGEHKVLTEVRFERQMQDQKWGGPEHDDNHLIADWVRYIEYRIESLNGVPRTGNSDPRQDFREIAALAVAAMESIDRKAARATTSDEGGGTVEGSPVDAPPPSDGVPDGVPENVSVYINKLHHRVRAGEWIGASIRAIPTPPVRGDQDLWLIAMPNDEGDVHIQNEMTMTLNGGERFYTVPKNINAGSRERKERDDAEG